MRGDNKQAARFSMIYTLTLALTAMDGGNADFAGARICLPEGEGNFPRALVHVCQRHASLNLHQNRRLIAYHLILIGQQWAMPALPVFH